MRYGIPIAAALGIAPWIFLLVAVVAGLPLKWVLITAGICLPLAVLVGRAAARRQRNRSRL